MTDRIEIDYAQLQKIIQLLQGRSDELTYQYRQLYATGHELRDAWHGSGADYFFDEMSDQTMPALRRLIEVIDKTHQALAQITHVMRQAEEQASNLFKSGGGGVLLGKPVQVNAVGAGVYGPRQKPTRQDYVDGDAYLPDGSNAPEGYKADVIFIPGIGTNADGFNDHLYDRSDEHPGKAFLGIFNDTEKRPGELFSINDVFQAWGDKFEARTGLRIGPDNEAVNTVKEQIAQAVADGREVRIEAHSQGGAILSAALMEYKRENSGKDLSNLTIITYGSAGMAFPPGPDYTHYEIITDYVPKISRLTDPMNLIGLSGQMYDLLTNREYHSNIVYLPPTQLEPHTMESYRDSINLMNNVGALADQTINDVGEFTSNVMNKGKTLFDGIKSLL